MKRPNSTARTRQSAISRMSRICANSGHLPRVIEVVDTHIENGPERGKPKRSGTHCIFGCRRCDAIWTGPWGTKAYTQNGVRKHAGASA